MRRPRVLLDVDGVLANFCDLAIEVARTMNSCFDDMTHDDIDQWDVDLTFKNRLPADDPGFRTEFWDRINSPGNILNIKPYPGAQETIKELSEFADIYYVTTPILHNLTWCYERAQWLIEKFKAKPQQIVLTWAKHLCQGEMFVDDKPSNVESWGFSNDVYDSYLFRRPYNTSSLWGNSLNSYQHLIQEAKERT